MGTHSAAPKYPTICALFGDMQLGAVTLRPAFLRFALALASFGLATPLRAEGNDHPGAAIYRKLCAECHGDKGQGVQDKYDEPLHGNRSVESLAKRIARTMPEDNVGACVGEDARAGGGLHLRGVLFAAGAGAVEAAGVRSGAADDRAISRPRWRISSAAFARASTSRPGARARLEGAATIEGDFPSRTGRQLRRGDPSERQEAERERQGARRVSSGSRCAVAFDFGTGKPGPGADAAEEFNLRWEGSVFAPETGTV